MKIIPETLLGNTIHSYANIWKGKDFLKLC
jgi:hypothetical protein